MASETGAARPWDGRPLAADETARGFAPREQLVLLAIFAAALVLRLLHLIELRANDPFFQIPAVDGRVYHAQARAIAGGDFGDGVLFLGPLYPWLMASLYKLTGPSLFALKNLQAALGAVDCLLVAWLARMHFSSAVALLAAAFTAVYGMLVFYGGTVMVVNVLVPLVLLSAICVTDALRRPSAARFGLAGVVVSAGVLARQDLLLYGWLVAAWIFFSLRERVPLPARAGHVAAFVLGMFLLVLPFTARNWLVGGDLLLLNSTAGMNLYMGNSERSNGAWVPPALGLRADSPETMRRAFRSVAERETGRALRPSEVSDYWTGLALQWIRENPIAWLKLEARKALLFWNVREVWNNRSIDISREFSWVLRLPLLGFGVVAPLALVGLGLSARRWRELFPLHALVVVYFASAMALFVLSRYRLPLVPVLLVFAAHTVVEAVALARQRDWKRIGLVAGWVVVLALVVHRDMGRENLFMAHFNVGNKYRDLGRYEEAIASYQKSLAINRGYISTWNNLALAYEGAGREPEAIEAWRLVLARSVEHGDATRTERAARHLRDLGVDSALEPGVESGPPDP